MLEGSKDGGSVNVKFEAHNEHERRVDVVTHVPMLAVGTKDGGPINVKCEAYDGCHTHRNKGTHTGKADTVATHLYNGHCRLGRLLEAIGRHADVAKGSNAQYHISDACAQPLQQPPIFYDGAYGFNGGPYDPDLVPQETIYAPLIVCWADH